jgi:hypothetical protein
MHRAKGLEFRAVVVMACDDEVIRSKERIEAAADDSTWMRFTNGAADILCGVYACAGLSAGGRSEPISGFLDDFAGRRTAGCRVLRHMK